MYSFSFMGAQFTLRTDHSSLRWLQKFRNSDGMLARWYMLLGQFSVTFDRPGAQHATADGLSRQCGQCLRPGCQMSSLEQDTGDADSSSVLMDQPFASSAMGYSMDADLLPELSGETWVAATYLEEVIADLLAAEGGYSSGTCQSTKMVDYGAAGPLQQRILSWWCLSGSVGS